MFTSEMTVEELPAPQPCGLCGRPTTRYRPELGIAFCGREQRPPEWEGSGEFAPAMRGGDERRGRLRRRGSLRRRRRR